MMTRMSTVGPEALSRRERISSGITSVMRESKLSAASASRRDKLLGISPMGSPAPISIDSSSNDNSELKDEDLWGSDYLADDTNVADSSDPPRLLKNSRLWLGLDKDPSASHHLGLSALNRTTSNRDATPVRMTTASRMIPQSATTYESGMHQSAPVNIPDWAKILGKDKQEQRSGGSIRNSEKFMGMRDEEDEDDDVGDCEESKLPPHELIAREYARSHTSFSVYEGIGRTLKGRDLRRVRNAVWEKTGFL